MFLLADKPHFAMEYFSSQIAMDLTEALRGSVLHELLSEAESDRTTVPDHARI